MDIDVCMMRKVVYVGGIDYHEYDENGNLKGKGMNIPSATHHANGDAGHNPTAKVVCPKEKNNRFY